MSNLPKVNVSSYLRKPLVKWGIIAFAVLFILYAAVGFFVVPGIIQSKGAEFVSEKFQRKLEFGKVSFNPLTLTVDLDGVKLSEHAKEEEFVSFDNLSVNLSSQSIFRMAPVIEEIRLVNPKVHLVRTQANKYNIDDFIAFAMQPKEDDSTAKFAINNIQVENAEITFDDQPVKKHHVVDQLNVSIPFISTIPSQVDVFVDLAVNGRFNQEKIELIGKTRPFFKDKDGTVDVKLDRIDLPTYMGYIPFKPNFDLKSGKLSIDLKVGFEQPENGNFGLSVEGSTVLDSLVVADTSGKEVVKLPQLSVNLDRSDVLLGKINVAEILLKEPEFHLERSKTGAWNVVELAKMQQNAAAASQTKEPADTSAKADDQALAVKLDKFSIQNGLLQITDKLQVIPAEFSVRNINFDVEGVAVDLGEKNATVEKVASSNAEIQFVHDRLKIQDKDRREQVEKAVRKTASEVGKETGFNFLVSRFELNDWSIMFKNTNADSPIVTKVTDINVAVDNISSDMTKPVQVSMSAKVNQRGSMDITGSMTLSPFTANLDLNLKDVDVRFVQPYIEEFVNLSIRQIDVSVKGKLQLAQSRQKGVQGTFNGEAGIGRFITVDQISKQPFVSWQTLALKGIRVNLSPLAVTIDQVALNDLAARIILSQQGRLNVQDILRGDSGERKSLTDADGHSDEPAPAPSAQTQASVEDSAPDTIAPDTTVAVATKNAKPDYSILIKNWVIRNGKIRFSDRFIRPNYTANLVNLQGSIKGLTTNPEKQAQVDVKGKVSGAPLVISGMVNPLSSTLSLDIKAKVKGMELAQFSAYSGKYIGYGIEKGKLSFDVAYKVENNQLSAENQLILDQLTLGEKVENDTAMNLPIHFALSLLKDRNGVIDINLPVGGSLDDPKFSVGGIIFKVFVNLIQKAVTSPFSLLASIVGDSEELSWVAFDPGSHAVNDAAVKKLEALAKALVDRPALKLEITGKSDPEVDSAGLGKKVIMRKLRAMKAKKMGIDTDSRQVTISDKEYPELLAKLYDSEKFDKPRNWIGFAKSVPVSEMEKLLSQHFAGKKDDQIQLANQRAQEVKDWLVEKGGVPEERVFILAGGVEKSSGSEPGNRVVFSLK